ncbi:hypothetical protein GCK32_022692, partial [Trichostrongylus colubriformis]
GSKESASRVKSAESLESKSKEAIMPKKSMSQEPISKSVEAVSAEPVSKSAEVVSAPRYAPQPPVPTTVVRRPVPRPATPPFGIAKAVPTLETPPAKSRPATMSAATPPRSPTTTEGDRSTTQSLQTDGSRSSRSLIASSEQPTSTTTKSSKTNDTSESPSIRTRKSTRSPRQGSFFPIRTAALATPFRRDTIGLHQQQPPQPSRETTSSANRINAIFGADSLSDESEIQRGSLGRTSGSRSTTRGGPRTSTKTSPSTTSGRTTRSASPYYRWNPNECERR